MERDSFLFFWSVDLKKKKIIRFSDLLLSPLDSYYCQHLFLKQSILLILFKFYILFKELKISLSFISKMIKNS